MLSRPSAGAHGFTWVRLLTIVQLSVEVDADLIRREAEPVQNEGCVKRVPRRQITVDSGFNYTEAEDDRRTRR